MQTKRKKVISLSVMLLIIPAVSAALCVVYSSRQHLIISFSVALLAMLPVLIHSAGREHTAGELALIAAMCALTVVGRALFAFVPHFKPMAAMIIITGVYLGREAGFVCGALSVFISNFLFGQGPWTVYQMLGYALIGLLGGLLSAPIKKSRVFMSLTAVFCGLLYSLLVDVWTAAWLDGTLQPARYIAALISGAPITIIYCVSNVIFLLALCQPIGRRLQRIKSKYGLDN